MTPRATTKQSLPSIEASNHLSDDPCVLVLDSGTTSVRSMLVDARGSVISSAHLPLTQHYPRPGWVEHDPVEIFDKQLRTVRMAIDAANISAAQIVAVGITNQRESTVVWDKRTGEPVAPAICWQCRRTAPMMEQLTNQGMASVVRKKTGLVLDPYFSASKIAWILNETPGVRERAGAGDLAFGTIDSWLVWHLTGGAVHATDPTNASRTMLYDICTGAWDDELCGVFDIPKQMLPEVRPSSGDFGQVRSDLLEHKPPITGVAGDQQASLVGHCCFEPGDAKVTYGTGAFVLMAAGAQPVMSEHGLLTTIAATFNGRLAYAMEGSVFNAGTVVQWLRDEVGLIEDAAQTEELAHSVEGTQGVYLVPAFTGLGAPWWDTEARGIISGITRGTGSAHIVRAALESEAYQVYDVIEAMRADLDGSLGRIAADGGGTANSFMMQFQADLIDRSILVQSNAETTAMGAAFLAGVAQGVWANPDELRGLLDEPRRFDPSMHTAKRTTLVAGWHAALERCRGR